MSAEEVTLTTEEQREVVHAGDKWRTSVHDEHLGDLFEAVERVVAARIAEMEAQVAGLEQMNHEKAAEIRRLRMGNHPAGRARRGNEAVDAPAVLRVRALLQAVPDADADALREALEGRDAGHEGGEQP